MVDVIIIGGGPGGLSAGLYACRAGLSCILLEREFTGGQAATTHTIENYPGIPDVSGPDLASKMEEHAVQHGLQIVYDDVTNLDLAGDVKKVVGTMQTYEARTVILAMGAAYRELNVPGEKEFKGAGVSYCATCDGGFFKGKTVAVIGGGDTAGEDAMYLSRLCEKVYLVHRRDKLRANYGLQQRVLAQPNIELVWNSVVEKIEGEQAVTKLHVMTHPDEQKREIPVQAVFVAVGRMPQTELVKGKLALTEQGSIQTDNLMQTLVPGVFAIGDVREKELYQIITAAADGAVAITGVLAYLGK